MKCKKCGAPLGEGDLFCADCGTKVEDINAPQKEMDEGLSELGTDETPKEKSVLVEQEEVAHKPKEKKKTSFIIIGLVVVAIIVIAVVFFAGPKETEIEAKDLAAIMYSDEVEKYIGDTFIAHGLLVVDTRSWSEDEGYYSICKNLEEENLDEVVVFKYETKVAEDVGTGSEVIVTGTIDEEGMYLNATEVEIINKVEPVFLFNDVDAMIESANDIINKKITVVGLLDNTYDDGVLLLNDTEDNGAILKNISNPKDMQYGIYTITGKFYLENGISTIDVEKYELVEAKVKVPYFESLGALFSEADYYRDTKVLVSGEIRNAGSTGYLFENGTTLELRGMSDEEAYNLNGTYVTVRGTLKGGVGDPYYFLYEGLEETNYD